MPPSPIPLDDFQQKKYDLLYTKLGKDRADSYAKGVSAAAETLLPTVPAAPPTPPAPVLGATPAAVPAPVTLQIGQGTGGRPTIKGAPQGMEFRGPTPPMSDIVVNLPSREELQKQLDDARGKAVKRRAGELQTQGISYSEATARAEREVRGAATTPRKTEFGAGAVKPAGYSEFAVRGPVAAAELSTGQALTQSVLPQVLETGEQAVARRRFEQEIAASKKRIQDEAKRRGYTKKLPPSGARTEEIEVIDTERTLRELLNENETRAVQIVKDEFGEDDPQFMSNVAEVRAALNAPFYAAAGELRPKMMNDIISDKGKDILRGSTTSEVQGRLVETKGVAALRALGGLSRFLVRGAEEAVVDPLVRGVVAGLDPNVTTTDLIRDEEMAREAGGGGRRIEGVPGAEYSESAAKRKKSDTGNFLRDVAFEVATGRSAIDDYIDAGVPEGAALPLGILTEFAIPITPIGVISDVAPAFKSVLSATPLVGKVGQMAARSVVGVKIASVAGRIADIPQVAKLRSVARSINTIPEFGEALAGSKVFRETFADAGSVRLNLAETVAREGADIGQLRATLNSANPTRFDDAAAIVNDGTTEIARSARKLIDAGRLDVQAGIKTEEQLMDELKAFANKAYDESMKSDSAITRTAVREGDKLGPYIRGADPNNPAERIIDVVRERVLAETIDAVPTDNYFFITDRMLVNRSVLNTTEFKEAMRTATSSLPADASMTQVNRAIEDAIRQTFRGRNASDIAEVSSVNVPRTAQQEGIGLIEGPRGGIERLQTAPSRRRGVMEAFQDVNDTRVAAAEWFTKNGKARFANALTTERVPVEVAEFMRTTSDKLDNVPGRMYAAFGVMARNGVPEVFDAYVAARINEDLAGGTRGVFDEPFYNGIRDTVETPRAAMDGAVKETLNLFFGPDNLRAVFGQDAGGIVDEIIRTAPDDISITRRVESAIADIRKKAPSGALDRTGMIRAFGSTGGDPRSAIAQLIMSQEARAAFRQGIADNMRPVYGTADDYTRLGNEFINGMPPVAVRGVDVSVEVRDAVRRFLNDTLEDGTPRINKITEDFKQVSRKAAGKYVYESKYVPELDATDLSLFSKLNDYIKEALAELKQEARTAARAASIEAKALSKGRIETLGRTAREEIAAIKAETKAAVTRRSGRGAPSSTLVEVPGQRPRYITQAEDIARIEAEGLERVRVREEQLATDVERISDDVRDARDEARIEEDEMEAAGVDLGNTIDKAAARVTNEFILQGMTPRLVELASRLEDARAAAGWGNHVTVESISKLVDLPLPAPLAKTLRDYFGNIDDLTKMNGIIGDNIAQVVSIAPGFKGVGQILAMGVVELAETARALTAGGLTAGMFFPNFRYHAVNFETAPLVQAFTSPSYLADTLGARLMGLLPGKQKANFLGVPSAAGVRAFRGNPSKILLITDNGVEYTAGRLNQILDNTFFGMSANTFVMSDRMLDDIITNTSVPSGFPGFRATAIEGLRFMGMRGTNPMVRYANKVDRAWRETAFLAALKNGLTPQQSIEIAKNAFLDYGKIPPALKNEFGKYMMFASWMIMNNAELVRAFLTPKGGANIIKISKAQREMHRVYGDYAYSDDGTKKRLWSNFIGDFDGVPAYSVGPENPAVGPMLDNIGPAAMSLYQAGATQSVGSLSDTVPGLATWALKNAFTPAFEYLKDIGLVGEAPMSDIVPAKSVAWNQLKGPDSFQQWMDSTGITVVPYDRRRPGEPTFNGEQYMFTNDGAKERWARTEFIMTFAGLQRNYNDLQQYMMYTNMTPPNMDKKRFADMEWYDVMLYMGALETRQRGKSEYEAYMRAMQAIKKGLVSGEGIPRVPDIQMEQYTQQAPQ